MKDFFIMVASHKFDESIEIVRGKFQSIHVGKALSTDDIGIIGDNSGENISHKNKSYCELTALFWAWKNIDAKFYGLMHYRRFFSVKKHFWQNYLLDYKLLSKKVRLRKFTFHRIIKIKTKKDFIQEVNELYSSIPSLLEQYDFILPRKVKLGRSNMIQNYASYHNLDDWKKIEGIIKKKYPEMASFVDYAYCLDEFYAYNMFICSKKYFNQYMEWLFDILFDVEQDITLTDYSTYQARVFGFLSERMFNIYIQYLKDAKHIKFIELDIIHIAL